MERIESPAPRDPRGDFMFAGRRHVRNHAPQFNDTTVDDVELQQLPPYRSGEPPRVIPHPGTYPVHHPVTYHTPPHPHQWRGPRQIPDPWGEFGNDSDAGDSLNGVPSVSRVLVSVALCLSYGMCLVMIIVGSLVPWLEQRYPHAATVHFGMTTMYHPTPHHNHTGINTASTASGSGGNTTAWSTNHNGTSAPTTSTTNSTSRINTTTFAPTRQPLKSHALDWSTPMPDRLMATLFGEHSYSTTRFMMGGSAEVRVYRSLLAFRLCASVRSPPDGFQGQLVNSSIEIESSADKITAGTGDVGAVGLSSNPEAVAGVKSRVSPSSSRHVYKKCVVVPPDVAQFFTLVGIPDPEAAAVKYYADNSVLSNGAPTGRLVEVTCTPTVSHLMAASIATMVLFALTLVCGLVLLFTDFSSSRRRALACICHCPATLCAHCYHCAAMFIAWGNGRNGGAAQGTSNPNSTHGTGMTPMNQTSREDEQQAHLNTTIREAGTHNDQSHDEQLRASEALSNEESGGQQHHHHLDNAPDDGDDSGSWSTMPTSEDDTTHTTNRSAAVLAYQDRRFRLLRNSLRSCMLSHGGICMCACFAASATVGFYASAVTSTLCSVDPASIQFANEAGGPATLPTDLVRVTSLGDLGMSFGIGFYLLTFCVGVFLFWVAILRCTSAGRGV